MQAIAGPRNSGLLSAIFSLPAWLSLSRLHGVLASREPQRRISALSVCCSCRAGITYFLKSCGQKRAIKAPSPMARRLAGERVIKKLVYPGGEADYLADVLACDRPKSVAERRRYALAELAKESPLTV